MACRAVLAWLVVVLGGLAAAAQAGDAVLVAGNGDRIQGHVVERSAGWLVFESDAFGRIRVREDEVTLHPADTADTAAVVAPPAAVADVPSPWDLELGLKLGVDRGSLESREDEVDAVIRLERVGNEGELHGNVAYGYTRTEGRLKDDDIAASVSYDRWLSERYFVSGRIIGSSDLVDDGYDVTRTISTAWGWRLFEGRDRYLRIGPALGYLWIERGPESFNGSALGLYARAKGPLVGKITYAGELQLLDSLDDGRYANLDLRLQHPLTHSLSLGLTWRYLWSDVAIDSGISSEWRWEITWRPARGD